MTAATDEAVARLEARVRDLEDRLEIFQLMATYGPCADSGSGDIVETLYIEDGYYDSGMQSFDGAAAIRGMIESLPLHRSLMDGGCAHMITMPVVKLNGDRAIAICHSQLLRRQDNAFQVWRTSANCWELERSPQGWKVAKRVNKLLDGDVSAQQLFRDALLELGF
jgi:SnoaL-like domain